MFRVPSSTPPTSPGRASRNGPSTTPAGPPPGKSFGPSSTPAGPPPPMNMSGLFGSTKPNLNPNNTQNFGGNSLFGSSPPKSGLFEGLGSGSIRTSSSGRPPAQRGRTTSSGTFRLPSSSPPPEDGDEDAEGEDDEDMDEEDYDDDMDEDEGSEEEPLSASRRTKPLSRFSQSVMSRASVGDRHTGKILVLAGAKQTRFDLFAVAKGLTPNVNRVSLQESDHIILETERLLEKVNESVQSDTSDKRVETLAEVAQELVAMWQTAGKSNNRLAQSSRLAGLLLSIHHPPPFKHDQRSSALALVPSRPNARHYTPIPKLLLDWLNSTYPDYSEAEDVLKESRGYSRHPSYWEAVQAAVLRGNFNQCMQLLQGAKLEVAATANDDGLGNSGYTGSHLRCANDAVRAAIDLLHECPVFVSQDWDVKGHDWTIFRQRVQQAYGDLQDFAEGDSSSRHAVPQPFTASHFGISQSQANFQLSVASRKAESKVPWSVYENLGKLYQLLIGNEEELLSISADWIEASLALAVWWNGEEEEPSHGSLAASRRSIMRSQRVRSVDITPVKAYCERISSALAAVIVNSDEDFSVNTTEPFEVCIACILDDNVEAALQILGSWSLAVASSVAEIASAGAWFTRANGIMDHFDQSDLMVLSYTEQQSTGATKDDFLSAYAKALAAKGELKGQDGQTSRDGWELAIQVLGRMDDNITASGRIEHLLSQLPLDSAARVDKITRLCHDLGLSQHATTIALKYADQLRDSTQNYGDTLLYYARAHLAPKIQDVLRVLVAHCLVKSMAYPPPSEIDDSLKSLIVSPKQTLTQLASLDSGAASMLSSHLSGYATIRKYYDLRDEEVLAKKGEKPAHRPMARRRAAANALMVIIASAGSSIRGGLYDPEIETVVQVDVLLTLLGEALVFVNQPKRTLTLRHLYNLMAAVEDLETAPSMIRTQCEEVLSRTFSAAHGTSSPQSLAKSTPNLTTASSQFSLIGSADFGSANGQSAENSVVLEQGGQVDESKRGWDWRRGFPKGASGEDIFRVLRLGIAKEIGRAFAEGEVTA